jgi:glycosyltransferase involved in cell wall biosynthesis
MLQNIITTHTKSLFTQPFPKYEQALQTKYCNIDFRNIIPELHSFYSIRDLSDKDINIQCSVIITSYNRYDNLIHAIHSVQSQTFKNIEILVINDHSSDPRYYEDSDFKGCKVIDLLVNSKELFGFACPGGWQRNFGMYLAKGQYIAFLDDDDYWFPQKLEIQIGQMNKHTNISICSSDTLMGNGIYDINNNTYTKYLLDDNSTLNKQLKYKLLFRLGLHKNINRKILEPEYIPSTVFRYTNLIICSSVMIRKSVIDQVGYFRSLCDADDYDYWLRILRVSPLLFIPQQLMYYDSTPNISYDKFNWPISFQKRNQSMINRKDNLIQLVTEYPFIVHLF